MRHTPQVERIAQDIREAMAADCHVVSVKQFFELDRNRFFSRERQAGEANDEFHEVLMVPSAASAA